MLTERLMCIVLGVGSIIGNIVCLWTILRIFFLISGLDVPKRTKIQMGMFFFSCGIILEVFILTSYVTIIVEEGYASIFFPKYRDFWFLTFLFYVLSALALIVHISGIRIIIPIIILEVLPVVSGILFLIVAIESIRNKIRKIQAWSLACTIQSLLFESGLVLWSGIIWNEIIVLLAIILRNLIVIANMRY
ncbi:MAG: hypothetical protein NDP19_04910 [Crenarchaeota archaeon]|nr:hypothetical protein [Thermoproteota archaeon]